MPITVLESPTGRKSGLKKASRQYVIKGATDESEALDALLGGAASSVNGMSLTPSDCDVEEITSAGALYYSGTASYSAPGDASTQQAGSFSMSFDISGQTVHYNQSFSAGRTYKAAGQPDRDFLGAINVSADGSVAGVDVVVPTMTLTVNYTADPADITDAYIATISRMVGSTNDAAFKEFAAGELLLTRISGSRRDTDNWDISFGFSVSENKDSLTVGEILVEDKKGWDMVWVFYTLQEDTTNHVMRQVPAYATVVDVYPSKSFDALGLP